MGIDRKIRLRNKSKLYNNCQELMLWNYIQIISTKDLGYLIKSGSKPSNEILVSKMEEINKEFSKLRGEETMVNKFDLISYKEELVLQVHFGLVIIEMLYTQVTLKIISPKVFDSLISELESWGFYLDKEKPLIEELENVKNEITALQTTIQSLDLEIYPEVDEKEIELTNPVMNFYSILLTYQRILKIDKIDAKTTSLIEFATIEKQVKEVIKQNKKQE